MTRKIDRVTDKGDLFCLKAFSHHERGLKVHASRELAKTVHDPVTGDIEPIRESNGIQRPSHQAGARSSSDRMGDVPVGGHLAMRYRSNNVVNALVEVHVENYDRKFVP